MPKPTFYIATLLLLHTLFTITVGVPVSGLKIPTNDVVEDDAMTRRRIGDCFEEAEMETEVSRRLLIMQKKYISYETLKRDIVPCDKPGASYYDCHAAQANPYGRGCEMITRCRGH